MAGVLHVRVDCPQGDVGVRVAGLHVRTVTTLSAGECGRASGGSGTDAETMGRRVITGPIRIMMIIRT